MLSDYESAEDSEVSVMGSFLYGIQVGNFYMCFKNMDAPVVQKYP